MSPLMKGRRARRLFTTSALALASVGVVAPAAHANPVGNWQIDTYRHYAADVQERVGSDEFYLATIKFKVQLGVTGTASAEAMPVTEIDDIDKGEYHKIPASMGQANFHLQNAWEPTDMFWHNRGPWVYGTVNLAMEADRNDNKTRNRVLAAAASALQAKLKAYGENITPWGSTLTFLSQAAIDLAVPKNKVFRDQLFKDWILGVGVSTVVDTVKEAGWWSTIKTGLRDDWIGTPRTTIVVGLDGVLGNLFNTYAGQKSTSGDQLTALPPVPAAGRPIEEHKYTQQYSGDGARYVLDVNSKFVKLGKP